MNTNQIIERLKPIVDRLWWCPDCGRFLQPNELGYAMGNAIYCIGGHLYHRNDLSIEARVNAYVKIVEELCLELEGEQNEQSSLCGGTE